MTNLIAVEFFKLRKRMMTWVVGVLLVALVILLYSVLWSASTRVAHFGEHEQFTAIDLRRALYLPGAVPYAFQIVGRFGAILAMVLAAGAVGSEYAWGTVRLMATASSGRLRLMSAKLAVVFGLVAAGTAMAVVTALVCSLIISLYYGSASTSFLTARFATEQFASYGRTLFVLAPYIALSFSAALIGRSTLAGAGAGLGIALAEPLLAALMRVAGSPWKEVPSYLLNTNTQIILLQNKVPEVLPRFGPDAAGLAGAHSPVVAGLLLASYTVTFLVIGLAVFKRRDIGSSQ